MKNSEGKKDGEVAFTRVAGMFRAKVKYMIYAVGPYYVRYLEENSKCELSLRECILNVLKCADQLNCKSIAIPAISTGSKRRLPPFNCA